MHFVLEEESTDCRDPGWITPWLLPVFMCPSENVHKFRFSGENHHENLMLLFMQYYYKYKQYK